MDKKIEKTLDVKVLVSFTDKHTGKKHKKGDVIKGITEKRFNEILEKGKLVEAADKSEK
jgi:hypothetical protein